MAAPGSYLLREGTLVLRLDGVCPSAAGSASPSASAGADSPPQLLQAAQVRAVDGDFLAVPLPQGIIVLLHHLQLVRGRVVQLVEILLIDASAPGVSHAVTKGWRAGSKDKLASVCLGKGLLTREERLYPVAFRSLRGLIPQAL